MTFMANHFSQANKNVIQWCHLVDRTYFYGVLAATALTYCGSIIVCYFPSSAEETELMRYIYKRSHPERQFQTSFWFPFIDDSESYYYEVIFYAQFFLIYLQVFIGNTAMSAIPCLVVHLIGQYKILCEFIEKLGREKHSNGFFIYYEDLKTNRFIMRKKPLKGIKRKQYEQRFFRQVIRFHQELIQFEHKLNQFFYTNIIIKTFFNNLIFILFLYQLTLPSAFTSKARLYKLIIEFVAFGFMHFYLCHCSDLLDDCNEKILHAIRNSDWMRCSLETRRGLCFLVRRVQRPNHLRFCGGAIVLSRYHFLRFVKLSYNVVNCMRLKSTT
uniref:Odorant receptor 85d n=1 Tax=Cacopsylla melanoneura TaxID=428564 RepID=A0A8D9BG15_9HEMI